MRREHDALGALESLRALENLRAEQIATLENRQTMEWLLSARGEATQRWWIAALDYAIDELHKLAGDEKGGTAG